MATGNLDITIDAALVAARLGLSPAHLMAEMQRGLVYQLTEKGEGEDAGRYRLTFRYRAREAVITVDRDGVPIGEN